MVGVECGPLGHDSRNRSGARGALPLTQAADTVVLKARSDPLDAVKEHSPFDMHITESTESAEDAENSVSLAVIALSRSQS